MSSTSASDIVTLTAVPTTSLKGTATFKARSRCKIRINGGTPVLCWPLETMLIFLISTSISVDHYCPKAMNLALKHQMVILKLRKFNTLSFQISVEKQEGKCDT